MCAKYGDSIEKNQLPHVIFDSTKFGLASDTVKSFAIALGLPTVSASCGHDGDLRQWSNMDEDKQNYLLQVMPPIDIIPEVIRSIVQKLHVTNVAILYDETFVMDHKYKSLLRNMQTKHVITSVAKDDSKRKKQIERLRKLNITNFFILGNLSTINLILETVKPTFFERTFAWYAITQNEGEITTKRANVSLLFLKPVVYSQNRERLIQLRTIYNLNEEPQIMSAFYFDLALRTFLAVNELLQSGTWPIDMEYLHCDDFQGGNTPKRNINLKQAFMQQAPFIMRDDTAPKGFKGFCIDLMDEIAHIANFAYTIEEVGDGKFGHMNEKGEWNGIVKELLENKTDIGLASFTVRAERENVIDFTVPYYDLVGIGIMMQKPKIPSTLFKFLTVLEPNVWLCILGAYFFTSFLMYILDRWSPYSYQNNIDKYKDDEVKRVFNLKECLWFCITSLTPQGGGEAPTNLSGRLVAATWWLFGFIIIASYTANLAAFLTVSRLSTPIESLDDLAKQYKISYAPVHDSSEMIYFERMANIEHMFYEIWKNLSLNTSLTLRQKSKFAVWEYPVSVKYTRIWQAMQDAKLPNTLDEAVARVRNSTPGNEFAFLGDSTDIRYLVLTSCDLEMIGEEFSRKPYGIAIQQGSHLKEILNDAILKLLNKQRLEQLKIKWWLKNEDEIKCRKSKDQTDGITIENIGGVFIIIVVGIGVSFIILVFEYWWFKIRKSPRVITVTESALSTDVK
ncbi:ionotropic receptor 25a isoform X3 [Stomoxys calcitrans]|uniref:ionotropic receptor 25a isoform X3 n=1 Tax=Stomoxys calcitrans TaxID=35570 RepID=UPI0027E38622|nr:ionotropic receptor 25a isoform X3 [Stomoxys calcitrans]